MEIRPLAELQNWFEGAAPSRSRVFFVHGKNEDERFDEVSGLLGTTVGLSSIGQLVRASGDAPVVVVCRSVPPTLARVIRERPPAVLIVVGEVTREQSDTLHSFTELGVRVLGPQATLELTPAGHGLIVACDRGLLRQLKDELSTPKLAICPTPIWFPELSRFDIFRGEPTVGFVECSALNIEWATWAQNDSPDPLVVPFDVPSDFPYDVPLHPSLPKIVAAHSLERKTGPVFPSPRVLGLLASLNNGSQSLRSGDQTSSQVSMGVWRQAGRALPSLGQAIGMQAPLDDVSAESPGASFLAQRVQLKLTRRNAQLVEEVPRLSIAAVDDTQRSEQVLLSAADTLSEHESKVVLHGLGVEITRQAVANSASGAASYADLIGYPVVLKAVSPDLRRKREAGAVELNLANAASVRRAYSKILSAVETNAPTASVDGVLVAEMIDDGLEIACGAVRIDNDRFAIYGNALGVPTKVETTSAVGPVSVEDAYLLADRILSNVPVPALRRASDPKPSVLAAIFIRLNQLMTAFDGRIMSVELSPVRLLSGDRPYVVLDARITQRPHLEGL